MLLIIGTSHVRHLDRALETAGYSGPVTVWCFPGFITEKIIKIVIQRDLSPFRSVICVCGSNDILRRDGSLRLRSREHLQQELRELYRLLGLEGRSVTLSAILPRVTHSSLYNRIVRQVNRALADILTATPALWKRKAANVEYICADGVHLTPIGKQVLMENLFHA